MNNTALPPSVRIGHVHLRVADLERATTFYRELLGFAVTIDGRPVGLQRGGPCSRPSRSTRAT